MDSLPAHLEKVRNIKTLTEWRESKEFLESQLSRSSLVDDDLELSYINALENRLEDINLIIKSFET